MKRIHMVSNLQPDIAGRISAKQIAQTLQPASVGVLDLRLEGASKLWSRRATVPSMSNAETNNTSRNRCYIHLSRLLSLIGIQSIHLFALCQVALFYLTSQVQVLQEAMLLKSVALMR